MGSILPTYKECFHPFNTPIESIALPELFTYPFNYQPHALCRLAAKELQHHLLNHTTWDHDFGIDQRVEGSNIGKMFGVLVVRTPSNEIGYLASFSGKVGGENIHQYFVPPLVDLLYVDSFYRQGELEISAMNHRVSAIEASQEYLDCKKAHHAQSLFSQEELEQYRRRMKAAKDARDGYRLQASKELSEEAFATLAESLKNESLKWQYDYKQLVIYWKEQLQRSGDKLTAYTNELDQLKEARKMKSAALQHRLFDQYHFLNQDGQTNSLVDIFAQTDKLVPPAGAGDCAAPRLFQYAFTHQLQPLAMAEFWWGQSPSSEIRQHGQFYPSCKGKCEPILGYMLEGISMDPNPVLLPSHFGQEPEIIFEDEVIGVLIKPAEYLSVPGKTAARSVLTFLQQKYPLASGPIIVHRLDMSTSGLMVFTKTLSAYHALQRQFLNRTVKKRYAALLDGLVPADNGIIDLPLRPDFDNRPRQLVCYQYGKPATTHYKVISRSNHQTRITFEPITGRTHQLRVHAAHQLGLHCPIVGDDLYGQRADRLCLHAEYLEFTHPITKQSVSFECDPEF